MAQYDAGVIALEKELSECKRALHLYHDRIVALAGTEDRVVQENSKWREQDEASKSVLPLSTHLKATNKLAQEYAAERRHLERSIAISVPVVLAPLCPPLPPSLLSRARSLSSPLSRSLALSLSLSCSLSRSRWRARWPWASWYHAVSTHGSI